MAAVVAYSLLLVGVVRADNNVFVIKNLKKNSVHPLYQIRLDYPVFIQGSATKKINNIIQVLVRKRVATMRASFQTRGDAQHKSDFSAQVQVLHHAGGRYSIAWLESVYYAGAAHPLSLIQVLNYDAVRNKFLGLSDVFKTTPSFYARLSLLCRQSLQRQFQSSGKSEFFDPHWFKQGTAADKKNFSSWSFSPQALRVYFAEYSIAPYAAGRFVVDVPWFKLKIFRR